LGENILLWRERFGREHTAVRVKGGRDRTAVEREGWERTYCCGERSLGENIQLSE